MNDAAEILGRSLTLPCGAVLANRLLKSAMSEGLADPNGVPGEKHVRLYRAWSEGGVGVAVTGNVMIDARGLGEPGNVIGEAGAEVEPFRRWAEAGTANGNHLWMQINHAGKQTPAFLAREPVAPSAIPFASQLRYAFRPPRALREEEILDLIKRFSDTAAIAREAGFTGVQIHAAHGYLVSQFLSPLHNVREDRWGGSAENRMRFLLEIVAAVRTRVGAEFPLSVKINSADFQRGGFSEDESLRVVQALAHNGVDLIELSGGNYESPAMMGAAKVSTREREAYFLAFAERVRERVTAPLAVTGGFRNPSVMAQAVGGGAVDVVGLARSLALDPALPRKILAGEECVGVAPHVTTGIGVLDQIGILPLSWYENQLARIAGGGSPNPRLNAFLSILQTTWRTGLKGFRQRRA